MNLSRVNLFHDNWKAANVPPSDFFYLKFLTMKQAATLLTFLLLTSLTFAQDYAKQRLEDSPRHHEWVKIKYGERTVHCFVAYPEHSTNTQAVIVIHENRGLNDWARSFADQAAEAGYLAIAPDLLSGYSEKFQKTTDFATTDDARSAIYELNSDQVTNDLNAVYDYISKDPACTGTVSVIGFCWGGSQSFRFATNNLKIKNAMVFYGTAPTELADIQRITAPVYGFYGGDDQRVNATIEDTKKRMTEAGKTYEVEIYHGAGHAFMRRGDDPESDEANAGARNAAWQRIKRILGE